jgi:hypothetical protein
LLLLLTFFLFHDSQRRVRTHNVDFPAVTVEVPREEQPRLWLNMNS